VIFDIKRKVTCRGYQNPSSTAARAFSIQMITATYRHARRKCTGTGYCGIFRKDSRCAASAKRGTAVAIGKKVKRGYCRADNLKTMAIIKKLLKKVAGRRHECMLCEIRY
jgi:hypothetical protein